MSTRRGFSLLEILVVAGVLLTSMVTWIYIFGNISGANQDQAVDQEYYFQYSLLLSRVKIDLRSALGWTKVDEGTYTIKVLADPKDGFPVEKLVTYKITGNGSKVERNDGVRAVVYDFSTLKGGNKFAFRISP
ncbi:MAG: hypothetical protein WA705_22445 [Candidatus Ozemobacteraceae bacterium]